MELLKSGGITLEQLQASGGAGGQNSNQGKEKLRYYSVNVGSKEKVGASAFGLAVIEYQKTVLTYKS